MLPTFSGTDAFLRPHQIGGAASSFQVMQPSAIRRGGAPKGRPRSAPIDSRLELWIWNKRFKRRWSVLAIAYEAGLAKLTVQRVLDRFTGTGKRI